MSVDTGCFSKKEHLLNKKKKVHKALHFFISTHFFPYHCRSVLVFFAIEKKSKQHTVSGFLTNGSRLTQPQMSNINSLKTHINKSETIKGAQGHQNNRTVKILYRNFKLMFY